MRELLTLDQIAQELQLNVETPRRWVRRGDLKALLISRRAGYRVARADLDDYLAKQPPLGKTKAPNQTKGQAAEAQRRLVPVLGDLRTSYERATHQVVEGKAHTFDDIEGLIDWLNE